MAISNADRERLASLARGVCQFPNCDQQCYLEGTDGRSVPMRNIAHIISQSDDGPRADPTVPVNERGYYANLLLLCPNHHLEIDSDVIQYPVDVLLGWKEEAEQQHRSEMPRTEFTFTQLDLIITGIMSAPGDDDPSVSLTPLREKMILNGLSEQSDLYLRGGLLQVGTVEGYIKEASGLSAVLVSRLIQGFSEEYEQMRSDGLEGDALFTKLRLFSAQGHSDYKYQSAGLSVLVYLFERCEVFERIPSSDSPP